MHRLSVVMVSDYEPSDRKSWHDETALIRALSRQDITEPFEVVLVENQAVADQSVPAEFFDLIPDLRVCYHASTRSATLKDHGVRVATGDYVAVLESDCIPTDNWLRLLLAALTSGDFAAASGRTWYGEQSCYRRVLNLLHRSWDDPGRSAPTIHISNNGAIYRRDVLDLFPYPDAVTPFLSAAMRNNCIREAGHRFWFERDAAMEHAIGGLGFIWDYQRNKGHQSMGTRSGKSVAAIPLKLARKLFKDCINAVRLGPAYLRWYDWPLLPVLMLIEIPPFATGAMDAVRGVEAIPGSAYR